MTRDTYKVQDSHGTSVDEEVLAALLRSSAHISRLPEDAPIELRKLVVELDDPKRVYAVHRASRRHDFQLLVERYIHQIRYGCVSKVCSTTTCFSCRRRLANGAPVRRYNATSARTLATYMASQDNPEQGLCRNSAAPRPLSDTTRILRPRRTVGEAQGRTSGKQHKVNADVSNWSSAIPARNGTATNSRQGLSAETSSQKRAMLDLSAVDEPTSTDPRSFVQNMFGTVAFKMLEWLTPRNIELLANSRRGDTTRYSNTVSPSDGPRSNSNAADQFDDIEEQAPTTPSDNSEDKENSAGADRGQLAKTSPSPLFLSPMPISHNQEPMSASEPHFASLPKLLTTNNDVIETQISKGKLSKVPKQAEYISDVTQSPKQSSSNKRRLSGRSSSNSLSNASKATPAIQADSKPRTIKSTVQIPVLEIQDDKMKDGTGLKGPLRTNESSKDTPPKSELHDPKNMLAFPLPQSLSHFSIESIEFLCNVMQADGSIEQHPLCPSEISKPVDKKRNKAHTLSRNRKAFAVKSSSYRLAWKLFVEQSVFDVLSRSKSILQSFRDEENRLLDTQTIWYLMFRLTRTTPSVAFNSLWVLAGDLFQPPPRLELTNRHQDDAEGACKQHFLSNQDAADTINICLHALVAAAPLVENKQELASMSRLRSHGLATRGKESSNPEHVALCLQYEDAFSYDLAVRLARRLFAAIPIRRRFADLLELQKREGDGERQEPDVLDTIIKSLDLGSDSALRFSDRERELHEGRMPTLILDWARAIMLQEWQGDAVVPNDGPFGGALAVVHALYKNRKSLLLGDIHFRTEYFAERLDPIDMPTGWLVFESNRRTVHLLDYPYLFNPSTLVTYFRALNYSRMNRAFETAKASHGLMHSIMSEGNLMIDRYRREQLSRRLDLATTKFNVLEIGRNDVLKDTFNAIWRREERELLRPLKVRLGEEDGDMGLDSGGVQQEFFRLAIAEAVNPNYGAFTIDSRSQMIWFQPSSPEPLWKYELIGMVVSLAVYNGIILPVTFPKALYLKLLGQEVTELHHIEDGWQDIAKGLTQLLEWDEKDGLIEDIFVLSYEFSTDLFGKPVSCEMGSMDQWPQFSEPQPSSNLDAPMVTNENRNNYVSDYIRYMTDISIRPQFEAFRKGFFSCIDRRSVGLFDAETLQSLIEGVQEIDIPEMRRATNYVGWSASHRTVRDFWSIVKRYDIHQKRKLLEFTTASDRVPVGGMKNLSFTLQRNGIDDEHLPTSYTCYGILLLPEYSSKKVLEEKLAQALENSMGFGFA